MCGVGDIPQPDPAVSVGGGQCAAVGAERHGLDGVDVHQWLAEQVWMRGIGDIP